MWYNIDIEILITHFMKNTKRKLTNMWYNEQVKLKNDKAVVKLRNEDGSFMESCIIPSVMYPLNGEYEVFTCDNTEPVVDKAVLDIFDKVKYQVGRCYTNTEHLIELLQAAGYDAKSYVGWLFVCGTAYPVHHCWAVLNRKSVLDLSDDYTALLRNASNFENLKDINETRLVLAKFHKAASKQPNSIRCYQVGTPSPSYFYVGCPCNPDTGRIIYQNLIKELPNHKVNRNVGTDGLNPTQRLLTRI